MVRRLCCVDHRLQITEPSMDALYIPRPLRAGPTLTVLPHYLLANEPWRETIVDSEYFCDPRVFVRIDFSIHRRTAIRRNTNRNKPTFRSNTANVTPYKAISWTMSDQTENYLQRRQSREDGGNNSVSQACEACLPAQPSNKIGLK